jgi:death on curing protein
MRYLTLVEIVDLHLLIAKATGGASGVRGLGMLESAVAQPKATFDGNDMYASLTDKAAALCFSIRSGTSIRRRQHTDRTCRDGYISTSERH